MNSSENIRLPRVIVDADACPRGALSAAQELCNRYGWECWTVANANHQIESENHVTVGTDPQEADIKVANITRKDDIVITHDIGLAALILGKGAAVLSPAGKEFSRETIDFLLEERNMKARFRRGGGRTKGPSPRTREDDLRFAETLEALMIRQGKI